MRKRSNVETYLAWNKTKQVTELIEEILFFPAAKKYNITCKATEDVYLFMRL